MASLMGQCANHRAGKNIPHHVKSGTMEVYSHRSVVIKKSNSSY